MSFAATLALIAGYERGAIKLRGRADSSLGARAALWGVNEIVGLTIASLLAGLATTPYGALPKIRRGKHMGSRDSRGLTPKDENARTPLPAPLIVGPATLGSVAPGINPPAKLLSNKRCSAGGGRFG